MATEAEELESVFNFRLIRVRMAGRCRSLTSGACTECLWVDLDLPALISLIALMPPLHCFGVEATGRHRAAVRQYQTLLFDFPCSVCSS